MSKREVITYVGLDAHKRAINVAVLGAQGGEWTEWQLANEPAAVRRLGRKLAKLGGGRALACYEAGPCGYALQRQLTAAGVECVVVAPSLVPFKPGDRIKTDRRDARKLAELLRADLLTSVRPPTLEEEAARDLARAREDAKQDLLRARHRLSKMLLRHGFVFRQGCHWTQRHRAWLQKIRFEQASAQLVLEHYLLTMEQADERVKVLEVQLTELAGTDPYAERVGWLKCLRGVDTVTAMGVLTELHGFERFRHPRELSCFLGLVPSEHSSSTRQRRGAITKAGNSHVRRLLVEAAWNYRHRPAVSAYLRKRRAGQPAPVIAIADRAQQRLHRRYVRLKERGKQHNVVTVAVARELVGFIWAMLTHEQRAAA